METSFKSVLKLWLGGREESCWKSWWCDVEARKSIPVTIRLMTF